EFKITPNGFGHLTRNLMGLAGGRLVLALEGGYNIDVISKSAASCVKALLGEPIPRLSLSEPKAVCKQTVEQVLGYIRPYWNCFGRGSTLGPIVTHGKGSKSGLEERLQASSFPLEFAVRWYSRSVVLGLLHLKPFSLPTTRIVRKGVVATGAVMNRSRDSVDDVDPVEVFASACVPYGDLSTPDAQIADGPSPYYHEFLSRGHPIATTDLSMELLKKYSKLSLDDALFDAGERIYNTVSRFSPSRTIILIGAGRGADVVGYLLDKHADADKRLAGAIQFCHGSRPKKVTTLRGPQILHTFVSGLNLDSTSLETVDRTSTSVAELMIRNFQPAINHIKKRIALTAA
ncbi:Histone deacetylase hda1, partial [Dinochytrium kinnereticum]